MIKEICNNIVINSIFKDVGSGVCVGERQQTGNTLLLAVNLGPKNTEIWTEIHRSTCGQYKSHS